MFYGITSFFGKEIKELENQEILVYNNYGDKFPRQNKGFGSAAREDFSEGLKKGKTKALSGKFPYRD